MVRPDCPAKSTNLRAFASPTEIAGLSCHAWIFMWVLGTELRSACLQAKRFIDWAVPPGNNYYLFLFNGREWSTLKAAQWLILWRVRRAGELANDLSQMRLSLGGWVHCLIQLPFKHTHICVLYCSVGRNKPWNHAISGYSGVDAWVMLSPKWKTQGRIILMLTERRNLPTT